MSKGEMRWIYGDGGVIPPSPVRRAARRALPRAHLRFPPLRGADAQLRGERGQVPAPMATIMLEVKDLRKEYAGLTAGQGGVVLAPAGRHLRFHRLERGGKDDDDPDDLDASGADERNGGAQRSRRPQGPHGGAADHRLYAGLLRPVRRREGLGVPGLFRRDLRGAAPRANGRDRQRFGADGPHGQTGRLRAVAFAGNAAKAVPRAVPGPRPGLAPPRRARLRSRPSGARRA